MKELIRRLEQDKDQAKTRMEGFEIGTAEHAFNQAVMLQASNTLMDIKMLTLTTK